MAAVISTLPVRSVVPRDALWKGKRKSFKGKLLQLRAKSFRSRSRRMPVVRVYARTRSTARPGSTVRDVTRSGNSLYDLLGISEQVSPKEIKKAYRDKARKYHPDSNPPAKKDECTQKFLQVQEAYRVLGDPDLKSDYDYTLRNPHSTESLKSSISFRRGKSRARRGATGCVPDEDLENKRAWRTKWSGQLFGLQSAPARRKPGSWAATIFQKRHETTSNHGF